VGIAEWPSLLFGFAGRVSRSRFWPVIIGVWVIDWMVAVVFGPSAGLALFLVLSVALLWPFLAVSVKRWHDLDRSGWWELIILIPVVGLIWAMVELGFIEGTNGPNRYGPDPLGGDHDGEVGG
jgi:uncharacterized membrane protein YhaH (DUF805 family)